MAAQLIITTIDDEGEFLSLFGQVLFTGNYPAGGDVPTVVLDQGTNGVSGTSRNTAGLPVFLSGQTGVHATRPPYKFNIQMEAGLYTSAIIVGTSALNFKIKQIVVSTGAELAAGAYPATLTGAVYNFIELKLKKNI